MDAEFYLPPRKQIISAVYRSKRSAAKIKTDTVKRFLNLFMLNKQTGFGASLSEIKNMTPEEGYFFAKNVSDTVQKLKEMRKNRGN